LPVLRKLPPLIKLCRPSKVGVEKSSYIGWIVKLSNGYIGVEQCCQTLPRIPQKSPVLNKFTGFGENQY
jgi:hypothetical protein